MKKNALFDECYYTNNNYASYLERKERYKQLVLELHHEFFPKIGLGNINDEPILDFGCAVGFIVRSLKDLSYTNIVGYDVSQWAIDYGKRQFSLEKELTSSRNKILDKNYKLVLALDVLEHLTQEELDETLLNLKTDFLVVRMPVTAENGKKYILEVSERDETHLIRWTKHTWVSKFESYNYIPLVPLQLHNIYDTDGVMCAIFRHKNAKIPFAIRNKTNEST